MNYYNHLRHYHLNSSYRSPSCIQAAGCHAAYPNPFNQGCSSSTHTLQIVSHSSNRSTLYFDAKGTDKLRPYQRGRCCVYGVVVTHKSTLYILSLINEIGSIFEYPNVFSVGYCFVLFEMNHLIMT